MSLVIASLATRAPTIRDRGAADHPDRDREPSRIWVLLEVLAYAGASIDPTAALAAQRFAASGNRSSVMAAGESSTGPRP